MTDTAALQALERWQLEPIISVDQATSGRMNEVFIVTTAQRKLVLRKHRRPNLKQVRFEHAVIAHAIDHHEPGDIIVLAGKGHETYQEIHQVKHHMDEREIVAEHLKARAAR